MCLYPKLILNRKYLPNKKNKGKPPPIKDERTKYVAVGCQKCMECKIQKKRQWQIRLSEELRSSNNGKFVTMTLSEESLNELDNEVQRLKTDKEYDITGYKLDNEIATLAVKRFRERWRKKYGTSIKHWLVTELGQTNTERLHIHGIIWTNVNKRTVEEIWKYGNVNKRDQTWEESYCSEATVNYIVKYINKPDETHKNYNPIVLTSSGIGSNFVKRNDSKLNKFRGTDTRESYTNRQGYKMAMPTYYRNKLYTEEEREQLWINLLDKETRYVIGMKIDISKNENDYNSVIKYARQINAKLGYGSDQKDWEAIKYEQQRRNIKRITRIKKDAALEMKRLAAGEVKSKGKG